MERLIMKENRYNNAVDGKSFFMVSTILAIIVILILGVTFNSYSQNETTITENEKNEIVTLVCDRIEKIYIFAEVAEKVCAGLKENQKNHEYVKYKTLQAFANRLDKDMQDLSRDKHLGIIYDPQRAAEMKEQEKKGEQLSYLTPEMVEEERSKNFGFKELKILDGNIGYLDLRFFSHPKYAGATAVSVMQYFSNCDALIIDLRKNGGGWGEMVPLITSYFFEGDTLVQLGGSYSRKKDIYYQNWTLPYVPGERMPDIPLYILTSKSTFSAAEAFSYDLKHLGRATIVGETTRGGAHPLDVSVVLDFVLYIPDQMSVNPITNTNWEGVGVKPDIEVDSEQALNRAYKDALIQLARSARNETEKLKYQWAIEGLEANINHVSVPKEILKSYVGKYDSRTIYFEDGQLLYQYGDRAKGKMIPLSEDYFMLDNYDYLRVRFIKKDGIVTTLEEIFDDGRILRKSRN
jgi:hypothetical protein